MERLYGKEVEEYKGTGNVVYCVMAYSRDRELDGFSKRLVEMFDTEEERDAFFFANVNNYGNFEQLAREEYLKD